MISAASRDVSAGRMFGLCRDANRPDGGFAVGALSGLVDSGYVVSVHPERESVVGGRLFPDDVVSFVYRNADLLSRAGYVASCWRDIRSGLAHLDVSTVVYDRREAVRLCREFDQLGFFDAWCGRGVRV